MDIAPATRGHALVIPRAHTPDLLSVDPEDLHRGRARLHSAWPRASRALAADGVNLRQLLRRRRLADRVPLPRPRHPALRRRPAAPALDARARRSRGDRIRRAGTRGRAANLTQTAPSALTGVFMTHMRRIFTAILGGLALLLALPALSAGDPHRSRHNRRNHARRQRPAVPPAHAWPSVARPASRSRLALSSTSSRPRAPARSSPGRSRSASPTPPRSSSSTPTRAVPRWPASPSCAPRPSPTSPTS